MTCNTENPDLTCREQEAVIYADHRCLKWLHGIVKGKRAVKPLWISITMAVLLLSVTFVVAFLDGVLVLPGAGVGLLEHYGNLSMLIVFPLALLLLSVSVKRYRCFVNQLPELVDADGEVVKKEITSLLEQGSSEKTWKWWCVVCLVYLCGILMVAINAYNTAFQQLTVYYHDTYDSVTHISSYVWTRICFGIFWGCIIPAGVLFWLKLVLLGRRVLYLVSEVRPFRLSTLVSLRRSDEDPYLCFVSSLLWPVLAFLLIIFALYVTHGITFMLILGTCLFVVGLIILIICLILPYKRVLDRSVGSHLSILGDRMDTAWREYRGGDDTATDRSLGEEVVGPDKLSMLTSWHEVLTNVPRWPLSFMKWLRLALIVLSPILTAVLGKIANILVK